MSLAKTPALTTPSMTNQEYASALGFELKIDQKRDQDASTEKKEIEEKAIDKAGSDTKKIEGQSSKPTEKKGETTTQVDVDTTIKSQEVAASSRPVIEVEDLIYQCDISLAQPFAVKNQEGIELALGDQKGDDVMVIKIRKTPLLMRKTHYEPEHLHIWSNTEHNILMTLEVEEVYKDKFVALQSGTLTILTPKLKEDYKAVLSCKP